MSVLGAEQGLERIDADVISLVLAGLPPHDLLRSVPTCSWWAAAATADAQWTPRCEALWRDKLHTERWRDGAVRRIEAYFSSLADALRVEITVAELERFTWSARVKQSSGLAWQCPWWQGHEPGTRRYTAAAGQGQGVYASSERGQGEWSLAVADCDVDSDVKAEYHGHSVLRTRRGGRSYPPHVATRTASWGWLLQSRTGLSASFPLPARGEDLSLEDGGALELDPSSRSGGETGNYPPELAAMLAAMLSLTAEAHQPGADGT